MYLHMISLTHPRDYPLSEQEVTPDTRLWSVKEVARFVRVEPITVYRWMWDGKLPSLKIGKSRRIHPLDLGDFLGGKNP
jgi:excisionase family DNA binding protein